MIKQGAILAAIGGLLLGYSMTVEIFPFVPAIPGVARAFRIWVFAVGLLAFSAGFALLLELLEPTTATRDRS